MAEVKPPTVPSPFEMRMSNSSYKRPNLKGKLWRWGVLCDWSGQPADKKLKVHWRFFPVNCPVTFIALGEGWVSLAAKPIIKAQGPIDCVCWTQSLYWTRRLPLKHCCSQLIACILKCMSALQYDFERQPPNAFPVLRGGSFIAKILVQELIPPRLLNAAADENSPEPVVHVFSQDYLYFSAIFHHFSLISPTSFFILPPITYLQWQNRYPLSSYLSMI